MLQDDNNFDLVLKLKVSKLTRTKTSIGLHQVEKEWNFWREKEKKREKQREREGEIEREKSTQFGEGSIN